MSPSFDLPQAEFRIFRTRKPASADGTADRRRRAGWESSSRLCRSSGARFS